MGRYVTEPRWRITKQAEFSAVFLVIDPWFFRRLLDKLF